MISLEALNTFGAFYLFGKERFSVVLREVNCGPGMTDPFLWRPLRLIPLRQPPAVDPYFWGPSFSLYFTPIATDGKPVLRSIRPAL